MKTTDWKTEELLKLDPILDFLPREHSANNNGLREITRMGCLIYEGKTYPSVCGSYRPGIQCAELYDSVFCDSIIIGKQEIPCLDLTLLTLIGFSLFTHNMEVIKFWAENFYPGFDEGTMANPRVKIFDRELITKELQINHSTLYLDPNTISLDKSFALLYASYVLLPKELCTSYPKAYHFFKDSLFRKKTTQSCHSPIIEGISV